MGEQEENIERRFEFVDIAVTMPYMVELGRCINEKERNDNFERSEQRRNTLILVFRWYSRINYIVDDLIIYAKR
jgi:hypothetical protein